MFWFKKKKKNMYKITWCYQLFPNYLATEYVWGKNEWDAWKKIKKEHNYPISCKYIGKIESKEE